MESINFPYILGFIGITIVLCTCVNYIIPYLALGKDSSTISKRNSTIYCVMLMCLLLVPILAYGITYIIYHSPEYYSYLFVGICMLIIFIYYYFDLLYYNNYANSFSNIDCVIFIIIFSMISYSGYMIRANGFYMPPIYIR